MNYLYSKIKENKLLPIQLQQIKVHIRYQIKNMSAGKHVGNIACCVEKEAY